MINSRDIRELNPQLYGLCQQFIEICADNGMEILIVSTYRDFEQQDALYAQGRTAPGKIITNSKAGYSYHNFRMAFDFVPIINDKAAWHDIDLFHECGEIGKELGLTWGGDFINFKDYGHFELNNGKTLEELRAQYQAEKLIVNMNNLPLT